MFAERVLRKIDHEVGSLSTRKARDAVPTMPAAPDVELVRVVPNIKKVVTARENELPEIVDKSIEQRDGHQN